MKKLPPLVLLMLLLMGCPAQGELEQQPEKICFVVDHCVEQPSSPSSYPIVTDRMIEVYDVAQQTFTAYPIELDWSLIISDREEAGLLFAKTANDFVDILGWNDGIVSWKKSNLYLPGCDRVLAYINGVAYYITYESRESYLKTFHSHEFARLRGVNDDGNIHDYGTFSKEASFAISNIGTVAATESREYPHPDSIRIVGADGRDTWVDAMTTNSFLTNRYRAFVGPCWLDENRLLFWGSVDSELLPGVMLPHSGMNDPFHYVHELLCYDIRTDQYDLYLDEKGRVIELVDKVELSAATLSGTDLLFHCDYSNPVEDAAYDWWHSLTYQIVRVSLFDGTIEVLHQYGNPPLNFDVYWQLFLLDQGMIELDEGEDPDALRAELRDKLYDEAPYDPLQMGLPENESIKPTYGWPILWY